MDRREPRHQLSLDVFFKSFNSKLLKAFQDTVPFNPSMMVCFRKNLREAMIRGLDERIV